MIKVKCRKCKTPAEIPAWEMYNTPIYVCDNCKELNNVEINAIRDGVKCMYFTFVNKPYTVMFNKVTKRITCDCHNGSTVGVNNKQLCKHKIAVLKHLGETTNLYKESNKSNTNTEVKTK